MQLKPVCEKCQTVLPDDGIPYVCSYECTFCEKCAAEMDNICPNCNGELIRRPGRKKNVE